MSENPLTTRGNVNDTFSPVTVTQKEFFGTLFLGLLSTVMLVALLRSESRNRSMLRELHGDKAAHPAKPQCKC